ncbi:MAG: TonB-dependent receptor [Caulobacteraceae bacterium]|nr:TonB-dependent receptor [Caulobacteraceae bacterium]
MTTVRSRLLATSALITALGMAAPALAQTAPAQEPQTDDGATAVEEVVVTGFRGSLERALNIKRNANEVVDSIVAEDMAKFPDNNLAESLQRVPGVTITRDGGEGRAISVRGLGPDFTRVRINGIEAQATTGSNRGRGFDFNVFASELFSQLDVRKTPSANVEEGSLGATVDLHTTRPFSQTGFKGAMAAQGAWNDLSEATNPRLAGLVSNRWDTPFGEFGASFSVAYSEKTTLQNGASTGLWNFGSADGGWCDPVARPTLCAGTNTAARATASLDSTRYPRFLRYQDYRLETKRTGLTGTLQWRPQESTLVTFDVLYSKFEGERNERQLESIGLSRAASQGGKPETVVRDIVLDGAGTAVYMALDNVDIRSENYVDIYDTTFQQYTLNVEQQFGDKLTVTALGGYVKNDFNNAIDYIVQMDRQNTDGYSYDFRPGGQYFPAINYGFDVTDPNQWYIGPTTTAPGGTGASGPDIRLRPNWNDNIYKTGQVDFKYDWSENLTLLGGLQAKSYEFVGTGQRLASGETNIPAIPAGYNMTSLTEAYCGFKGLALPSGTPNCWRSPSLNAIAEAYGVFSNTGRFALSSTVSSARGDNRTVNEDDIGGYLQAQFKLTAFGMPVRGDVGYRRVHTKQESGFYSTVPVTVDPSGFQWTTVSREYDDDLPSMNLVVEPTEDFLIRFGAAKVMARPGLGSISAATNVSVAGGSRTVTTGNPNLEPYRAKTYDVAFEWYPARGSIVSAGFFYKDISTYIQNITTTGTFASTGLPDSLLAGTGVAPTDPFQISNVINTPGGPLKGVELNLQQALTFLPWKFQNLGILMNYTYVKSDINYFVSTTAGSATVTQPLLNLSKNAFNTTLYYEEGPFQARVSLNYRDKYLTAVPSSYNTDVAGVKATTFVDFSTSYKWGDHLTFTLEGINLTNEPTISYTDSSAERLSDYFQSGRQFYAGARYAF